MQFMTNDLEIPDGELPDDDPEIIAGMERLGLLRKHEDEIPDLLQRVKRRLD